MFLLANVPLAPKFEFGQVLLPALLLVGGILLAALVLILVKKWNQQTIGGDSPHDQLALFRDVYQHGEMSPEEYKRVHNLLAGKIRQESDVPAPPPPPVGRIADPSQSEGPAGRIGDPSHSDAASPNGQPPKAEPQA